MIPDNCPKVSPGAATNAAPPPVSAPPQIHLYKTAQSTRPATGKPDRRRRGLTAGFVVLSAMALVLVTSVVGLTGYFRLSSPTAALRTPALVADCSAVPPTWLWA